MKVEKNYYFEGKRYKLYNLKPAIFNFKRDMSLEQSKTCLGGFIFLFSLLFLPFLKKKNFYFYLVWFTSPSGLCILFL